MYYKLIELSDGTEHELEYENICDIQACLRIISEFKRAVKFRNYKKIVMITKFMPNLECLSATLQKLLKVSVPDTPY